jgi:para-aminobenzoate synthetase/4-amino-4-deoxychorismate lyase
VNAVSEFPLAWMAVFDAPLATTAGSHGNRTFLISEFEPQISAAQYREAIHSIRDRIERGETYQVNFTFPLKGCVNGDSFGCFRSIGESQGAAYSAYLDIGTHQVLSFSPELFVERRGDRLTTRPMKGTLARGRWAEEDSHRAEQLRLSAKDRAENVMIVDMLRSDLGKIAETGSVEVPDLFSVEALGRVLQMTSTVTAVQKPDTSIVDILRALFPCGSVTGAPKPRTMAIIKELEPAPRGIYTGAVGLLYPNGDVVFNVAIRTLVIDPRDRIATFCVGGGITWDSTPDGEYEECRLKANFLTHPWPNFELLETMALKDGEYTLLERHLARARDSARYFGFRWKEKDVEKVLTDASKAHPFEHRRVRLIIARSGAARVELHPLNSMRQEPLLVKFATCPVDDRDPLIFHKITARSRYDAELTRCRPCDDVIFWNSRGEVTESTIANVVVFSEGKHWTPPREAGLLAGTLREELIANGELFERTITRQELASIDSFSLINSVRGWMSAKLAAD